jgi:predicted ATPase
MDESEIEKYLFDPENPQGCEGYRVLLSLVKKGNTAAIVDPFFGLELISDKIFDKDVVATLWEKPTNFNSFSIFEKKEVYVENFSLQDFIDFWDEKFGEVSHLYQDKLEDLFLEVLTLDTIESKVGISMVDIDAYFEIDKVLAKEQILAGDFGPNKDLLLHSKSSPFETNIVLLSNDVAFSEQIFSSNGNRKSVLICTRSHLVSNRLNRNSNVAYVVLESIKDLHLLLESLALTLKKAQLKKQKAEKIGYLDQATIENYFALESLELSNLNKGKEVYFLGENGDGKTLILQALALSLVGNKNEGEIINVVKATDKKTLKLQSKDTDGKKRAYNVDRRKPNDPHPATFAYGVNRNRFANEDKDEKSGYLSLFDQDQQLINPVTWLQLLLIPSAPGEEDDLDFATAKEMIIDILDRNISDIKVSRNGAIFIERGTKLSFKQLSDGFRSVIVWLCDLVARLYESQPYVTRIQDFRGIVLVDEIGLMLHPKWQYGFVKNLRKWFPKIQFFFTTHSPTVVLGASEDAIFYKVYKEDGVTKITDPITDLSGYGANALLTSPLFDLETAVTRGTSPDEVNNDEYEDMKINRAIKEQIAKREYKWDDELTKIVKEELAKYGEKNDKG